MPDMNTLLLRTSLDSLAHGGHSCEQCERTPLAGERLLELESGPLLCELCFGQLPDERRAVARTERVHTSARRLAVVPRAA
jgi:hypothetical protein